MECTAYPYATTTGYVTLRNSTAVAGNFFFDDVSIDESGATTTNVYDNINFPTAADWWTVPPGLNTVGLNWGSGSDARSTMRVDFRHAWK